MTLRPTYDARTAANGGMTVTIIGNCTVRLHLWGRVHAYPPHPFIDLPQAQQAPP